MRSYKRCAHLNVNGEGGHCVVERGVQEVVGLSAKDALEARLKGRRFAEDVSVRYRRSSAVNHRLAARFVYSNELGARRLSLPQLIFHMPPPRVWLTVHSSRALGVMYEAFGPSTSSSVRRHQTEDEEGSCDQNHHGRSEEELRGCTVYCPDSLAPLLVHQLCSCRVGRRRVRRAES